MGQIYKKGLSENLVPEHQDEAATKHEEHGVITPAKGIDQAEGKCPKQVDKEWEYGMIPHSMRLFTTAMLAHGVCAEDGDPIIEGWLTTLSAR